MLRIKPFRKQLIVSIPLFFSILVGCSTAFGETAKTKSAEVSGIWVKRLKGPEKVVVCGYGDKALGWSPTRRHPGNLWLLDSNGQMSEVNNPVLSNHFIEDIVPVPSGDGAWIETWNPFGRSVHGKLFYADSCSIDLGIREVGGASLRGYNFYINPSGPVLPEHSGIWLRMFWGGGQKKKCGILRRAEFHEWTVCPKRYIGLTKCPDTTPIESKFSSCIFEYDDEQPSEFEPSYLGASGKRITLQNPEGCLGDIHRIVVAPDGVVWIVSSPSSNQIECVYKNINRLRVINTLSFLREGEFKNILPIDRNRAWIVTKKGKKTVLYLATSGASSSWDSIEIQYHSGFSMSVDPNGREKAWLNLGFVRANGKGAGFLVVANGKKVEQFNTRPFLSASQYIGEPVFVAFGKEGAGWLNTPKGLRFFRSGRSAPSELIPLPERRYGFQLRHQFKSGWVAYERNPPGIAFAEESGVYAFELADSGLGPSSATAKITFKHGVLSSVKTSARLRCKDSFDHPVVSLTWPGVDEAGGTVKLELVCNGECSGPKSITTSEVIVEKTAEDGSGQGTASLPWKKTPPCEKGTYKASLEYSDKLGGRISFVWPQVSIEPVGPGLLETPEFRAVVSGFLVLFVAMALLFIPKIKGRLQGVAFTAVVLGGGGLALAPGLCSELQINRSVHVAVVFGGVLVTMVTGALNPSVFCALVHKQPFQLVGQFVIMFAWIRRGLYRKHIDSTRKWLERQRKAANDEQYVELPARMLLPDSTVIPIPAEFIVEEALPKAGKGCHAGVLIVGVGGSGKSALARQVVELLLASFENARGGIIRSPHPHRAPVPIYLTKYEKGKSIEKAIEEELRSNGASLPEEFVKAKVRDGEFAIVLDDVGEATVVDGDKQEASPGIKAVCSYLKDAQLRTSPLVAVTRGNRSLDDAFEKAEGIKLQPEPLTEEDSGGGSTLSAFVEKYGHGRSIPEQLKNACRGSDGTFRPLLVRLALMEGAEDAETVADVYNKAFKSLIAKVGQSENALLSREQARELCLGTYWKTGYRRFPRTDKFEKLLKVLNQAGIVVSEGSDERIQRFFHDSMQSFLTADALAQESRWDDLWEAAGHERFLEDRGGLWRSELFAMCCQVFLPPEALADRLISMMKAWVAEPVFDHEVSRATVQQSVPRDFSDRVAEKSGSEDPSKILQCALEEIGKNSSVLGELFANLAPIAWNILAGTCSKPSDVVADKEEAEEVSDPPAKSDVGKSPPSPSPSGPSPTNPSPTRLTAKTNRVDVVILTALLDEYKQLLKVTDGSTSGQWQETTHEGGRTVAFQDFKTSDGGVLSVAATWALEMGGVVSATMATELVKEFEPQCLAMCGICAGRRTKTSLGDVIIADRLWIYDTGKVVVEDGKERVQGDMHQYRFPSVWKQAAQVFADNSWLDKEVLKTRPLPLDVQEQWVLCRLLDGENLRTLPDRKDRVPAWSHVLDRLRIRKLIKMPQLELTPKGKKEAEMLGVKYPDAPTTEDERLKLFDDGLPRPKPFKIHLAPIATGNKVVEDIGIFDRLSSSMRKVRGLEMEAATLGAVGELTDVKVVVAKAVADHANHDKNDNFRAFASRASAECLIAFLRQCIKPFK